eukprot:CAMPEP_0202049530 /NCGR_PEP_ID=MMETSP0963-20130614/3440_1 /ASSEMBLY_ACC=CAM_ASM_000494 /TAXON_ID=4773 /ORGANISM="Schizochytrium aggregatum, Strain ATCC28209" /LENGTH=146 /DNA_ID=CAMNT_0048614547 /DNA_START=232 /DNA_END=669 /DNA_ORIENTATION=-
MPSRKARFPSRRALAPRAIKCAMGHKTSSLSPHQRRVARLDQRTQPANVTAMKGSGRHVGRRQRVRASWASTGAGHGRARSRFDCTESWVHPAQGPRGRARGGPPAAARRRVGAQGSHRAVQGQVSEAGHERARRAHHAHALDIPC